MLISAYGVEGQRDREEDGVDQRLRVVVRARGHQACDEAGPVELEHDCVDESDQGERHEDGACG